VGAIPIRRATTFICLLSTSHLLRLGADGAVH
jgi:hypothetical protein